jgi:hypothetical protein
MDNDDGAVGPSPASLPTPFARRRPQRLAPTWGSPPRVFFQKTRSRAPARARYPSANTPEMVTAARVLRCSRIRARGPNPNPNPNPNPSSNPSPSPSPSPNPNPNPSPNPNPNPNPSPNPNPRHAQEPDAPRSEVRGPRPDARGPMPEVRGPRPEVRGPMPVGCRDEHGHRTTTRDHCRDNSTRSAR